MLKSSIRMLINGEEKIVELGQSITLTIAKPNLSKFTSNKICLPLNIEILEDVPHLYLKRVSFTKFCFNFPSVIKIQKGEVTVQVEKRALQSAEENQTQVSYVLASNISVGLLIASLYADENMFKRLVNQIDAKLIDIKDLIEIRMPKLLPMHIGCHGSMLALFAPYMICLYNYGLISEKELTGLIQSEKFKKSLYNIRTESEILSMINIIASLNEEKFLSFAKVFYKNCNRPAFLLNHPAVVKLPEIFSGSLEALLNSRKGFLKARKPLLFISTDIIDKLSPQKAYKLLSLSIEFDSLHKNAEKVRFDFTPDAAEKIIKKLTAFAIAAPESIDKLIQTAKKLYLEKADS